MILFYGEDNESVTVDQADPRLAFICTVPVQATVAVTYQASNVKPRTEYHIRVCFLEYN